MSLRDKFRWEGYINSTPNPTTDDFNGTLQNYESFVMLVRDIKYQDITTQSYKQFNSMYDVATKNKGNYIEINNNYKSIQDPPNPNSFKK